MTDQILVVEEDEDVRAVLVQSLEDDGHEVVASEFGPLPRGQFAVVVTDVPSCPYRSTEARRWVGELRERYGGARILLCTAQRFVHREPDKLGADAIVDKPFDLGDLFARVSDLLGGSRTPREPGLRAFAAGSSVA